MLRRDFLNEAVREKNTKRNKKPSHHVLSEPFAVFSFIKSSVASPGCLLRCHKLAELTLFADVQQSDFLRTHRLSSLGEIAKCRSSRRLRLRVQASSSTQERQVKEENVSQHRRTTMQSMKSYTN